MPQGRFSPAQINFQALADMPGQYQKGMENYRERQAMDAFSGGLPMGPNGEVDFGKAISLLGRTDPKSALSVAAQLQKSNDPPASVQEYQYARQNGFSGSYADWKSGESKDSYAADPVTGRLYNKATGQFKDDAGGTPTNPYATGKMNDTQGKAATYVDRMSKSHKIITDLEGVNDEHPWAAEANFAAGDTGYVGRFLPEDMKKANQAQRDFINATLRRESGAVISPEEFANAKLQYFPQPGDSAEVKAQKRANRETTMQGIAREAGPNYNAPQIGGGQQQAATPGAPAEGQTATNPQTGEKIKFQAGQWVPFQ